MNVYDRAATILADRGWIQGDRIDPATGAVDVVGASLLADGVVPDDLLIAPAYRHERETEHVSLLASLITGGFVPPCAAQNVVSEWNDAEDRTEAQAIALLRRAAKASRRRAHGRLTAWLAWRGRRVAA